MLIKNSKCNNVECPTVYDNKVIDSEMKFDVKINLTDHTGTLINCRFTGKPVEDALECTVSFFYFLCSYKHIYRVSRSFLRNCI